MVQLPLKFSKTINKCLLQRMARMEMDCNLEQLGQVFQVLASCLAKTTENLLWFVLPS